MTLSKNSKLAICHADSGILNEYRSAFNYVGTASRASAAVTIVKAEGFSKFVVVLNFVIPCANYAFREVLAASYKVEFQLSMTVIVRDKVDYAREFNLDFRSAQT